MLRNFRQRYQPAIRFTCEPADVGVFAEPVPAKSIMPDWFKRLPASDKSHASLNDGGLTIKRCMPFLDAMTTGWIVPLAATVRLEVSQGGTHVEAGWDIDREMVSFHGAHQVTGHPSTPRPACKFHNYWTISTPPGWSCLIVPPLNRPHPVFEIVSGVVDTDTYRAHINLPFFATEVDGLYTLDKGTPIAQVIPFKRDATALRAEIRAETTEEAALRERVRRSTKASEGWYRKTARADR